MFIQAPTISFSGSRWDSDIKKGNTFRLILNCLLAWPLKICKWLWLIVAVIYISTFSAKATSKTAKADLTQRRLLHNYSVNIIVPYDNETVTDSSIIIEAFSTLINVQLISKRHWNDTKVKQKCKKQTIKR